MRKAIQALVSEVMGDRADAKYLGPVLQTMLTVAVQDFERYHDRRLAEIIVRDTDILIAWRKEQRAKAKAGPAGGTEAP